jgi:ATP phosphoribosyltransferase regulatory subunit
MQLTPSGLRDLTGKDVQEKVRLQNAVLEQFEKFGYRQVMTPAIEYYQTYNTAFSTLEDRSMYKFFDENGDILTLRTDMTVPIARLACSKNTAQDKTLRLSYASDVWKVRKAFAGKRSQVTDCGIELIGGDENDSLEAIVLALKTLMSLDLPEWTLELGDVRFFQEAAKEVFENEQDRAILQDLIDRKAMVELRAFLDRFDLSDKQDAFFFELPLLFGKEEILASAKNLVFDEKQNAVLDEMIDLYDKLCELGFKDKISFDFGKLPHLNYYTGLTFQAYTLGVGSSICSGGRYDSLLEKFGKARRAVGFSIKLDSLLDIVEPESQEPVQVVVYPSNETVDAFVLAGQLRRKGNKVEMRCDKDAQSITIETREGL